jgi:chromosome segregation ATPase
MSSVFETMELAEISKRLSFLDQERRKDKELVATLQERIEGQIGKIDAQARQIQELQSQLTSTRAELVRFTKIERSIEQLREELILLIENNEEKRDRAYRELSRLRQVEQETLVRQIAELRKELKPIPRYDEEIQSIRAEMSRFSPPVIALQNRLAELEKRVTDRVQSLAFLEEQRRQDTRRIAQTEAEIPKLRKGIDELVDRFPLLEQAIRVKNKEIDKAAEILEQQTQVIENQRVTEFRWERRIAEWAKLVDEIKQETAEMTSQTVRLREQHEMVRRALSGLDPFRERIERRQDEMAEMLRLGQDRQKRTMEEWQAEQEKGWERFKLEHDERWRENARFNEKRFSQIQGIEEVLRGLREQIEALWEIPEAWAESFMIGPREWASTWGELASQRPAMPEPLKPASSIVPEQKPMIRPLPSARGGEKPEEEA